MSQLPSHARVVIIGGGIIGTSIAYHLTKLGWSDVIVIERGQLTCGTTWHAAGLVNQLRTNYTLTQLSRYGADLNEKIEQETGQSTGFKRNGNLQVARTHERFHEIKRMASIAHCFDVDVELLTPSGIANIYPMMDTNQIVGGMLIPGDGQTNPIDTTMALAKGAKQGGARFFENTSVTDVKLHNGAVKTVCTSEGNVECEILVNCAGIWARELGKLSNVNIPSYASEHMYVVTEGVEGVHSKLPVIRDTDGYVYIKEDAGRLMVGAFEPECKPLPMSKLPATFEFGELPEDWDHFELPMLKAIELVPDLEHAQICHFLNGPESFTPDNRFIIGEAPEVKNYFVATGFNSQGILSAAGIGLAMSEWIVEGAPTMDLAEIDIARFHKFQRNERYLHDRIKESLGLLYAMHWPHRQMETARPIRQSPLHSRLEKHNACFGEAVGWERPNWYAPEGVEPAYEYSYGKQNWFEYVAEETKAVRERVGMFDLSSFAKFLVQGPDAEQELNRICANNVAVTTGRCVYTAFLNPRGGFEADVTVTKRSDDEFMVVTAAASQNRDLQWLRKNFSKDARVTITDITSSYAVLAVMGPDSRELLSRLTNTDLSNESFPFATFQEIEIGYATALAMRMTYVGELGWELYIPAEFSGPIFDLIMEEGKNFDLKLAGYHALDALRMEKGYRHWGHDITPIETPIEAGLSFAVSFQKDVDFIGRSALEKQREEGIKQRLVFIKMNDPELMLFHDEPIYRNGEIVGHVTSGAYGYTVGASLGMGYISGPIGVPNEYIEEGEYEIEIAAERYPATISADPLYDPRNTRIRS